MIVRAASTNPAGRPVRRRVGRLRRGLGDGEGWIDDTSGIVAGDEGGWGGGQQIDWSLPSGGAAGGPGWGQQLLTDLRLVLPAGMQTLQAAVLGPGQVIRNANGSVITGPGGSLSQLGLTGGISTGTMVLLGVGLLAAVFAFSKKG